MTIVTLDKFPTHGAGRGAIAGILAGAVAVGIGQLVGAITGPDGAPLVAVGEASIDSTPAAVKNFAISTFGSNDKLVLLYGIGAVLAVFAALVGILALRKLWYGLAGLGIFAVIGLAAAATRPTATPAYVLPTLAGAVAGAYALMRLVRTADPAAAVGRAEASTTGMAAGTGRPAGLTQPERRKFLVTGATATGTSAVALLGGRYFGEKASVTQAQRALRVPAPASLPPRVPAGADFKLPGLSPFMTPNKAFYRVDTAIVLPEILPSSWHLRIHGMVQREINLTFGELIRRPLIEDYVTLACVSNPVAGPYVGNALWLGASLRSLLREAGIRAGADQLLCTSADGFNCGSPVQTAMDGRDAMLAIAMNGQALPVEHGFPVRMVVPGLYGYVSACKWITDIHVTTYAANVAYWAQRGWSQQAPIKTESRIDVPSGLSAVKPGRTAIAGVAWAQHKGIDAVEVRVDHGRWNQATLAPVPGIDCWRQWLWDWNATPGKHVIEARATDKTGYTQTPLQQPPEPNGASGYPSVQVTVTTG
jgi:DMSO/TMAO reductase YedYZ molybdopterin-dependent catalytic subunit